MELRRTPRPGASRSQASAPIATMQLSAAVSSRWPTLRTRVGIAAQTSRTRVASSAPGPTARVRNRALRPGPARIPFWGVAITSFYAGCAACAIFAQVSRSVTVRLKTGAPGVESGSTQK